MSISRLEDEIASAKKPAPSWADDTYQNDRDCQCRSCEPRPTLVEYRRVVEALNLCLSALQRHDDWCGHLKDAPGDSIYRRAEEAAKKALWPTS